MKDRSFASDLREHLQKSPYLTDDKKKEIAAELASGKVGKTTYRAFNMMLIDHDRPVSERAISKFYGALKEAGYGAIADYNDREVSGYNAKSATIFFDGAKQLAKSGARNLTDEDIMSDTKKNIALMVGKATAQQMGISAASGVASAAANKAIARRRVDAAVKRYQSEHPNSKMSYSEIKKCWRIKVMRNSKSEQTLTHHGVLGMKWGIRKDRETSRPRRRRKLSAEDIEKRRIKAKIAGRLISGALAYKATAKSYNEALRDGDAKKTLRTAGAHIALGVTGNRLSDSIVDAYYDRKLGKTSPKLERRRREREIVRKQLGKGKTIAQANRDASREIRDMRRQEKDLKKKAKDAAKKLNKAVKSERGQKIIKRAKRAYNSYQFNPGRIYDGRGRFI